MKFKFSLGIQNSQPRQDLPIITRGILLFFYFIFTLFILTVFFLISVLRIRIRRPLLTRSGRLLCRQVILLVALLSWVSHCFRYQFKLVVLTIFILLFLQDIWILFVHITILWFGVPCRLILGLLGVFMALIYFAYLLLILIWSLVYLSFWLYAYFGDGNVIGYLLFWGLLWNLISIVIYLIH